MQFFGDVIAQIHALLVFRYFAREEFMDFLVRFAVGVPRLFLQAFFEGEMRQGVVDTVVHDLFDGFLVARILGDFEMIDEIDDAAMLLVDEGDARVEIGGPADWHALFSCGVCRVRRERGRRRGRSTSGWSVLPGRLGRGRESCRWRCQSLHPGHIQNHRRSGLRH